jgi:hypothetical protein
MPEGADTDQSEAKDGNLSENASEFLHPQPPRKEKKKKKKKENGRPAS